jgi:hypothetical protein
VPGFVATALGPFGTVLSAHGVLATTDLSSAAGRYVDAGVLALVYVVIWRMPNTQQIMARYRPALGWRGAVPSFFPSYRISARWGLVIGALAMLALTMRQASEFIYFQF